MASNAIIPCTTSSSLFMRTHDVFVSFRGEDTRNNFTAFLIEALGKKGIDVFKDDTHLKKGESIAPELLQAIEGSLIFVVVFSKNYASSTWCLRELAHICNCIETPGRHVLPIFCDVDPSDVRKQGGCYEKAFAEHEKRFREDKDRMEEVQRWKEALTQVANLSGWDIQNKPQYAEIEKVVQNVINILGHKFSKLPNDNLVGMESRVEEVAKLLCLRSVKDVRVVGISGMGGIGKTTLGRALYERISNQYDFHCFIDDVSKLYRDSGALGVLKQLLSQCLNEKNFEICNVSEGTCLVWTRLRNGRALIVLDNVDQVGQLKMFTGSRENLLRETLGGESRIIIISRDEHILRTHGVDDVYQVQPLNHTDAVRLFYRNAFKSNCVKSGYEKFTYSIMSHTQGHPLAIEVLGSSLFGRNVSQWRSALTRLRENKSRDIMDVLRISFDELDDSDKEIFLDIACFFNNKDVQEVKEVLEFRGFHPEYGLQVLIDKSLITYMCQSHDFNIWLINMHDLLVDLGRCIVREKSPKQPRKWSRLWNYKDLRKVMSDNMTTENLEAIVVHGCPKECHETTMSADALSKMSHLQLLELERVNFSGNLSHLSSDLGYLKWDKYPFQCLPPSFQPDKLLELSLTNSNVEKLWEGTKPLLNLRLLDLSGSKNLIKMPDLGEAPNLECLCLGQCIKLKQIDPSVGLLRKLTFLDLQDCRSLIKLPHVGGALNLSWLNLEGCIKIMQIDPSIGHLRELFLLNLTNCKSVLSLPNSILGLNSLRILSISGCSKLYDIRLLDEPRDEYLKKHCIGEAPIHSQSMFSFIKMWPLSLLHSGSHKDSVSPLLPSLLGFPYMLQLNLSYCNLLQIPDAMRNLRLLEALDLSGNCFVTLPSLKDLSKLLHLNLQHCKQLKYLCELPSRTELSSLLNSLPSFLTSTTCIRDAGLYIYNCPELVEIERCTSMGFSWMIKLIEANHRYNYSTGVDQRWPRVISSIIPGSEIPKWFYNQHVGTGSIITIETSTLMQQVGNFSCCVVFSARPRGTNLKISLERRVNCVLDAVIPMDLDEDVVTDKIDHMGLFYFSESTHEFSKLEVHVSDWHGFAVEVKKYGYRWDTDLIMKHWGNLSAQKRKFSAIEENK